MKAYLSVTKSKEKRGDELEFILSWEMREGDAFVFLTLEPAWKAWLDSKYTEDRHQDKIFEFGIVSFWTSPFSSTCGYSKWRFIVMPKKKKKDLGFGRETFMEFYKSVTHSV